MKGLNWDLFLSHASEDTDAFAQPLFEELRNQKLEVWFDQATLEPGDPLLQSINYGLVHSRFCLVIISPHYLSKTWTQLELSGIFQLLHPFPGRILTVWYQVSQPDIAAVYPILADFKAVSSSLDFKEMAEEIKHAIQPVSPPEFSPPEDPAREIVIKDWFRDLHREDVDLQKLCTRLEEMEPINGGWYHTEIQQELLRLLHSQTDPIDIRVRAGNGLALIGDPRFRPDIWCMPDENLLGFVDIPAGPFAMGSEEPRKPTLSSLPDEPKHLLDLPRFLIGRYPVTNAQYRIF